MMNPLDGGVSLSSVSDKFLILSEIGLGQSLAGE